MIFFDDYCDKFYTELGLNYRTAYAIGQIYRTHAYYPHENVELFRPVFEPTDKTRTTTELFKIEPAGGDAFNRGFPLGKPKLGIHEEFLAIRAKQRPVVLLQPKYDVLDGLNKGMGKIRIQRNLCTVAQSFGLVNAKGDTRCDPALLRRIRCLEFPQFLFLPQKAGVSDMDALLRLDELQSVFAGSLEPTQYRLSDEVLDVLRYQLEILLLGRVDDEYEKLRKFLLTESM